MITKLGLLVFKIILVLVHLSIATFFFVAYYNLSMYFGIAWSLLSFVAVMLIYYPFKKLSLPRFEAFRTLLFAPATILLYGIPYLFTFGVGGAVAAALIVFSVTIFIAAFWDEITLRWYTRNAQK